MPFSAVPAPVPAKAETAMKRHLLVGRELRLVFGVIGVLRPARPLDVSVVDEHIQQTAHAWTGLSVS